MPGYVSRESADRWNHAARIVAGGGAGSHFVKGKYRPPRGGVESCPDLGLSPGSYPAVAGATIAAGTAGPVVYDGNIYQVQNQSQCEVLFGDLIVLHVSPNCEAFFVACVCDCEATEPTDCCDKSYSICIDGTTKIVKTTSTALTGWPLCCTFGPGLIVQLFGYITCNSVLDQIVFNWVIGSGLSGGSNGSLVLTDLCSTGEATETLDLSDFFGYECIITINAADELIDCEDCDGNPPSSECCDQSLYFCLNGVSQLLAVNGGTYTWDVSACCDATASLQITLSCNPSTGVISMAWQYTAGAVFDAGAVNISVFCTDGSPRIFDFPGATCFLQMLISQVEFDCAECTGGGTTITTPPPPVTPPPPGP